MTGQTQAGYRERLPSVTDTAVRNMTVPEDYSEPDRATQTVPAEAAEVTFPYL